jgi:hypothetical protein
MCPTSGIATPDYSTPERLVGTVALKPPQPTITLLSNLSILGRGLEQKQELSGDEAKTLFSGGELTKQETA